MGDQPKDFVSLFHLLEGDTISDRKRNFNKLLRNPSFSTNIQSIHDALDKLEPKTYLEGLFKIDALIFFRHSDRLFEIIKEGNEVYISKILKQNWFFEKVFQNMDANVLINDFLPCLSFAMRMKVLKRVSVLLNENKMDDIYNCLYERYGLWIASKILHTCTREKIEYVLENEEIKLSVSQVLHLFSRTPYLLDIYVNYYKKTFDETYCESKITNQIALKNPVFLFKLEKEKKILVSDLGRRTSKHVFDAVKDDISADFDHYKRVLNKAILIKKLGGDFKDIYAKIFPKKISEIGNYSECRTILNYYPKNGRWPLFETTFQSKFPDKDINETFSLFGKQIMSLNPNVETARKWAEYIYKKDNNERVLKYLATSEAIPLIKEKINVTSDIFERGRLVKLLLQTCKKNHDLTALEDVLKYFCARHRNEDVNFRQNFLNKIQSKFELDKLNESHWKYIMEQIKILRLKKECNFWQMPNLLRKHLEFLFKKGDDLQPYIIDYIQFMISGQQSFKLDIKNPEIEQKILMQVLNVFEEASRQLVQNKRDEYIIVLIKDIVTFCKEYPEYFIDLGTFSYIKFFFQKEIQDLSGKTDNFYTLFEDLLMYKQKFPQTTLFDNNDEIIEIIVKCCKQEPRRVVKRCLNIFFLKKNRNDFENKLLKAYFNSVDMNNIEDKTINWFLRNEPTFLIPYFTEICEKYPEFDIRIIKMLSHLSFDNKLRSVFIKTLESDDMDHYSYVVQNLSKFLPTDEFVTLIDNKFVPEKPKLDHEDEEMCKFYEVCCKIVKELHNVEEPFKILPLVMKFCLGDYLQSALPALQSIFYRSPEKEIYSYIIQLSKKSVSVRKHAVFLGSELLKKEYVKELLSNEESNVSSRKSLFQATLKYFRKNPCDNLRNLLFTYMYTIDKNDAESLEQLAKASVPKRYKGSYVEKCWEFYEKIQSEGINVNKYFVNLLECVNTHKDILIALPPNLMEKIINEYYFKISNPFLTGKVIVKYLDCKCETEEYLLEILLKKLLTVKKSDIEEFFSSFQRCLKLRTTFIVKLAKVWKEYFTLINAFDETVFLDLLSLEYTSTSKKNLAAGIIVYMEELTAKFSLGVTALLRDVFAKYVSTICNSEEYELLDEIVKEKPNTLTCVLVLGALSPVGDHDPERYEIFLRIIQNVKNVQEPLVSIYYNLYLKEHNLE